MFLDMFSVLIGKNCFYLPQLNFYTVVLICEEISVTVLKLFCHFVLVQDNADHDDVHIARTQVPHRERPGAQLKKMKLGEQPECAADVQKLCSTFTNNFAIIECLQSDNLAC